MEPTLEKVPEKSAAIEIAPGTALDRAMGCIVGAFCGDAIGAPLEFNSGHIPADKLEKAMQMDLVGTHHLKPGQITDDSELALCLLHGLVQV